MSKFHVVFVSVVLLLVIICSSSRAEGASTFVYGFMIRAMFVRYSPVFVSINIETGAISSIGTLGAWIQPSSCTFGGNADSTFYATGLIIDKDVNAVLSIGLSSSGSSNIGIFPLSQIPTSTSLESGITGSSTFLYRRHGGSYWNYTKGTSNVVYGGEFPSCSNSPNCMQLIDSKRNEIWTPQGVQSGPQGLVYSINVKNYQYGYQRNITMGSHYWQGFVLNPLDSCLYGIYQIGFAQNPSVVVQRLTQTGGVSNVTIVNGVSASRSPTIVENRLVWFSASLKVLVTVDVTTAQSKIVPLSLPSPFADAMISSLCTAALN